MAVKYVKDFEFPGDKGFTGSAGAQHVKGYARGGTVRKAMGGDVSPSVDPAMPVKGSAADPQTQVNPVSTDGRDGRRFGPAAAGGVEPRAAQTQRANVAPRKGMPAYNSRPLVQQAAKGGPAKPVKKAMGGMMGVIPALMSKDKDGLEGLAGSGALGVLGLLASAARKKKAAPAADLAAAPASAAAVLAANQQANQLSNPPASGMAKGGMAKGGKAKINC